MADNQWLTTLWLVLAVVVVATQGLRLGSFNIEIFNTTKGHKDHVMGYLAKTAVRYDIMAIIELRDPSMWTLKQLVQRIKSDHGVDMKYIATGSIGTDIRHIEQYAFLYREDKGISIVDSYLYDDGDEAKGTHIFEREPFMVRFRAPNCVVSDLALVAFHPPPLDALHDLKLLMPVYEDVRKTWPDSHVIILGDLNADCKFVRKEAWPQIEIRQRPEFYWPIDDDADTMVKDRSMCAYDRFILAGQALKDAVVPGSAKPFNTREEYGLTETQALEVSDHFPIELVLRDVSDPVGLSSTLMGGLWNLWTGHYIIIIILIVIAFLVFRRRRAVYGSFGIARRI
ncbi:hypothetical protein BaRGS_00008827 [Batillaria attramentaria]|uniref:Endonuclease/exonuclease/phosphatase domain-containing protein n=1 Tax=Batillaria attramentaria TaxID=370345 RepID=A0ABD0LKC1_9CAEN